MNLKSDALLNLADRCDNQVYCQILLWDFDKKEACVRVAKKDFLQAGHAVQIQAYDEFKGLLLYEGCVEETEPEQSVIKKLRLVSEEQRRSDVRIRVGIPLRLREILTVSGIKGGYDAPAEILNLSAGGMLLKTNLDVVGKNTSFIIDLPLEGRRLHCTAEIVRKQIKNSVCLYGCRFLNDENDKAEIRKFVFAKQIETMRER